MSQENVELVRRGYAAFVGGDPSGVVSFLDPEIETHDFPEVPDTGVSRGREGFVALVENVVGEFDEFRLEPEEFTALDENQVLVMVRTLGRGKGSGVDVEARAAHLWTIRDRKAVRLRLFGTRDEALEAARLSE